MHSMLSTYTFTLRVHHRLTVLRKASLSSIELLKLIQFSYQKVSVKPPIGTKSLRGTLAHIVQDKDLSGIPCDRRNIRNKARAAPYRVSMGDPDSDTNTNMEVDKQNNKRENEDDLAEVERKRRQLNQQQQLNKGWVPIPTSNRFAALTPSDNDIVQSGTSSSTPKKPPITNMEKKIEYKPRRAPPITVIGKSIVEVKKFCEDNGLTAEKIHLKPTSQGVNVYLSDEKLYPQTRELFKKELSCFAYDLLSEEWFKVVIKGLFKDQEDELNDELQKRQITPAEIKIITPKKPKFKGAAHFILYFKKGAITLQQLRQHRALCSLVVEWEYYSPKKYGPTQCHRCQEFGHGSRWCSIPEKCMYCAGPHFTSLCENVKEGKMREEFVPKCANCKVSHTANHESCPSYQRYLEIQESLIRKNSKRLPAQQNTPLKFATAASSPPAHHATTSQLESQPSRKGIAPSYSRVLQQNSSPNELTPRTELFSPTEMIQIANEVLSSLRHCKTPEDQY